MINSVYLIVEPIEIIANDLAMNVQDYDPAATVLVALSPAAACEVLKGRPSVHLAIVHANATGFATTDLGRALAERGAKLVFAGDAAERNGSGILVLHRPFSGQSTAAVLRRAERSENA